VRLRKGGDDGDSWSLMVIVAGKGRGGGGLLTRCHTAASGEGPGTTLGGGSRPAWARGR
jgi:hypothetical protein